MRRLLYWSTQARNSNGINLIFETGQLAETRAGLKCHFQEQVDSFSSSGDRLGAWTYPSVYVAGHGRPYFHFLSFFHFSFFFSFQVGWNSQGVFFLFPVFLVSLNSFFGCDYQKYFLTNCSRLAFMMFRFFIVIIAFFSLLLSFSFVDPFFLL